MTRLFTGTLIAGGWLLLLLYGSPLVFHVAMVAGAGLMLREYTAMAMAADGAAPRLLAAVAALVPVATAGTGSLAAVAHGLVGGQVLLFCSVILLYQRLADPFAFLAKAGFAVVWIGLFSAAFVLLFAGEDGWRWLLFLTLVVGSADTAALYAGTFLGRHKLCTAISPKKTVEGLAGGLAGAVAAGLLSRQLFLPGHNWLPMFGLCLLLALLALVGDLTESVIKRSCGVKDSGTLLPGHGGILDRVDAMLVTAPVLYYIVDHGLI